MTIDDLLAAVRVADPQLSPDGRTVAFVRTTTDVEDRRSATPTSGSCPADGSAPPTALIGGDKSENTPRFSPDGRRIAFISTRDGAPQVYVADADGSDVRKVTDLAMGVQPPLVFSADGSKVAFVSDVYPECPDEACNKTQERGGGEEPGQGRTASRGCSTATGTSGARTSVTTCSSPTSTAGEPIDVTPGDFDSPPTQQEDAAIAFSPDGREIAFVSNREGGDREAWTTNNDVWSCRRRADRRGS